MYAIHAILVDLVSADVEIDERKVLLDKLSEAGEPDYVRELRYYASSQTDEYENNVFDWRIIELTGEPGTIMYPNNVIIGKLEKERFLSVFEEFSMIPEKVVKNALIDVKEKSNDVPVVLEYDQLMKLDYFPLSSLSKALDIIKGKYVFDSQFWSVSHTKSLLLEKDKEDVRKNYDEFAIVLFECSC